MCDALTPGRRMRQMAEATPRVFAGHSMLCPYEEKTNAKGA